MPLRYYQSGAQQLWNSRRQLNNPTMAVSTLDDDEKNTLSLTEGIRGNPTKLIVNEYGLYCLIIRSKKPQAKPFRKWVTIEVLPSIRKIGS